MKTEKTDTNYYSEEKESSERKFHSGLILEYSGKELEWLREAWDRRAGASHMK
jgi:hypothetical protein